MILALLLLSCGLPQHLSDCRSSDGDPTMIFGARIERQNLVLDVAYGGGCEEHKFALCWPDGDFMESDPVQVWLELYRDDPNDLCDAFPTETLRMDLAPLAQAWRDSYGDGPGQMTVHIEKFVLDYAFD